MASVPWNLCSTWMIVERIHCWWPLFENWGAGANTTYSDLVIHKGVEGYWGIEEYDGYELFDACCLTQPFIDIRALVFNESMSSADKIEHMKKAYREFDHISALGQTLNAQNPPDR